MRYPVPRFTVRGLMVAVAMTPIVLFSGLKATELWPIPISAPQFDPAQVKTSPGVVGDIEVVYSVYLSPWPGLAAMVTTTAVLVLLWTSAIGLRKRGSPSNSPNS